MQKGSTPSLAPRLRGAARALTLELFAEARSEWGFASDLLARAFRKNRQLGSSDRRLVSEAVYGLIRWDRRLEAITEETLSRRRERREALSAVARAELKLLIYEVRSGLTVEGEEFRRLMHSEPDLTAITSDDAGLGTRVGIEREAVRRSYPSWLLERFVADVGEPEAMELADAMNRRAPLAIRVNTLLISRDKLAERLANEGIVTRPAPLSPFGLLLETRVNVFGLSAFTEGLFEVMDEGSQLVAEAVAPPPGGKVVDACAGAGGKTLGLAALLGGQGRILALDSNGKKLEELRRRARRAGLSNVAAREVKGSALPDEARLGAWDRVLVDAPCSGLGTLRRNPEARWRLTSAAVDSFPPQQLSLLVTYAPLVAVGGRLVYATCTVMRSENDQVIERFLAERPDFVLMPLKEIWGKERALPLGGGSLLRLTPQAHDTDGFFTAVMRRIR
jgi:16S rRNA (cytosine967-C5)-methyltransferase